MRDRPTDTHRRIAERKLGRKLGPNEIVHHGDENKENNDDSNLTVEARGKHTAHHNRTRRVSKLRESLRLVGGRDHRKLY